MKNNIPLQLTKKEITAFSLNEFLLPIPKRVFENSIQINPNLALDILKDVKNEWKKDFYLYVFNLPPTLKRKELQRKYFVAPKKMIHQQQHQQLRGKMLKERQFAYKHPGKIILPLSWNYQVELDKNGFAQILSLENHGANLYHNNNIIYPFSQQKIPLEKLLLLGNNSKPTNHAVLPIYSKKQIADPGEAIFLRNWGLVYINKILEKIQ